LGRARAGRRARARASDSARAEEPKLRSDAEDEAQRAARRQARERLAQGG